MWKTCHKTHLTSKVLVYSSGFFLLRPMNQTRLIFKTALTAGKTVPAQYMPTVCYTELPFDFCCFVRAQIAMYPINHCQVSVN